MGVLLCRRSMPHTYTRNLIHIVFSTKERRSLIKAEIQPRLWSFMSGMCRQREIKSLALNGTANHVHMLIALPATWALADAVREIKAGSSKWVNEMFLRGFAWQQGYGAFSVAQSTTAGTIKYIAEQERHHRRRTFEEEFIALLEKHNVEYNLRFVFD